MQHADSLSFSSFPYGEQNFFHKQEAAAHHIITV
jgi:hypothetical protein